MNEQPEAPIRIWRAPLMLGALTAAGLTAGLLGDGVWDAAGVAALAAPVIVTLWCLLRPMRR